MKIVLTGPESVGKSTLAKQLADHFRGIYVDEFARNYIRLLDVPYVYSDVEKIVKQQLLEYDNLKNYKGFCFFDTYLIISKIWFLHVFKRLPAWFEYELKRRPMDLYLLCKDDLSWVEDGVRENEAMRSLLFEKYEQQLEQYKFCYKIIEGSGKNRLNNAIKAIEEYKTNKEYDHF